MKKAKKDKPSVRPCTERDRLWKTYLTAVKEWQSVQVEMAKQLRRTGEINPDVKKIRPIQKRIKGSYKLFRIHIEKHDCWSAIPPAAKRGQNTSKKRK